MLTTLLKLLISLAGSEIGKEAIKLGAKKLVESTDNGIDNDVVEIFLDNAVASKRNKLTETITEELVSRL